MPCYVHLLTGVMPGSKPAGLVKASYSDENVYLGSDHYRSTDVRHLEHDRNV